MACCVVGVEHIARCAAHVLLLEKGFTIWLYQGVTDLEVSAY
jgi:hypothetical protein